MISKGWSPRQIKSVFGWPVYFKLFIYSQVLTWVWKEKIGGMGVTVSMICAIGPFRVYFGWLLGHLRPVLGGFWAILEVFLWHNQFPCLITYLILWILVLILKVTPLPWHVQPFDSTCNAAFPSYLNYYVPFQSTRLINPNSQRICSTFNRATLTMCD